MPQIGVQQPTNLMEMYSSPSPMLWDIANTQVNQQRQSNEINQQQALQAMLFEQQDQPLNLQTKQATLDQMGAQLPGIQATSSLNQDKATLSRNTLPQQERSALSKLAQEVNDNDLKAAETQIQMGMLSRDPKIRAQAEQLGQNLQEIYKERQKIKAQTQGRLQEIGATTSGQKQLEQMRIDAGEYANKNMSIDFWANFGKLKSSKDKHAALLLEAKKEEQEGNAEGSAKLRALAEEIRPQAEAEIAARAQPDQIDLNAMSQGKIPTKTTPGIGPTGNPAKPTSKKLDPAAYTNWKQQAKQLNPNLSDLEIEQEAIKRGYK